ncbi:MAG: 50S ribosomal protein L11 methyltransferase, partial [Woeseia sp.]
MNLESLNPELVEEIFLRRGAHSVTFSDAGDDPVLEPAPGETPLWSDTCVTGLFSPDADLQLLQDELLQSLSLDRLPPHRIESLEDRAWEREWLRDFGPMRFGERLWVCPGDSEADADDAIIVRLDPGLAFGTGTHATTALCLEWLAGLDVTGRTLLDYGCGSGILSVAALKLGCTQVTAMDIDPQAVTATRENAVRNGVERAMMLTASAATIAGQFDIVVANILAAPLIDLADSIARYVRTGG